MFKKALTLCIVTAVSFSCSTDANQSIGGNSDASTVDAQDVQTVLRTDSIVGVADNLLSSFFIGDGATGKNNGTDYCYTRENTDSGYILSFTGCTLDGVPNITGIIRVDAHTERDIPSYKATYVDFYIGDHKIEGTRTFLIEGETNGSYLTFSITSNMELILADGTKALENGTRFVGFMTGNNVNDFVITLDGSWNLTVGNDSYTVATTDPLQTRVGCTYVSEGKLSLEKNGLTVVVDFGDGTCDDEAKVTYPNGSSKNVSLSE